MGRPITGSQKILLRVVGMVSFNLSPKDAGEPPLATYGIKAKRPLLVGMSIADMIII